MNIDGDTELPTTTRAHGRLELWRDFAVRSSGFPVEGLEAFGAGEDARLAAVARDPAFREAVAWQSRESLARAVDKLGAGAPGSPSRRRRWTDVVASYWQRYCSKNDTIGFFGPLAWGSFGEATDACARAPWSASASCTSRRGRWRRSPPRPASHAAADGPVPRARPAPAARRHGRARPPRARARSGARRAARGRRRRARRARPRVRGGRPGGRRRASRATAAAAGRSPTWTACATST